MLEFKSEIAYSYQSIKVTKSRIDKGLLAIPVALLDRFPNKKKSITIFFDDEEVQYQKSFTPYSSSSRECRIGGLSSWFTKNKFQDNDEIIIDFIDVEHGIYRLRNESVFIKDIKQIEENLIKNIDLSGEIKEIEIDDKIESNILVYSKKTNLSVKEILLNQYVKMKDIPIKSRAYIPVSINQRKESVPLLFRKILEECYEGKCQLTNFTFLKKNGKPYYEIHHIDDNRGNDWKNLLLVSPNIHAQFTFSNYHNIIDSDGWLREVTFDKIKYNVKQLLPDIEKSFVKVVYE